MKAVVTTGLGGYDRLHYGDVPVPVPGTGEALIRVLAAGVNNTDINTRLGWYSADVDTATDDLTPDDAVARGRGGWDGTTPFPLIQGTDCCGIVEAVGPDTEEVLVGRRVLVRSCMRKHGFESLSTAWLGVNFHGAFAEYVSVPISEVFPVQTDWSDVELGSIPCAYGTAENLLHRAGVGTDDEVLVTGASGGVGSAVVQLAKRRGAVVKAVCSAAKADAVRNLGADDVIAREELLSDAVGSGSVDVVIDNVAGPGFGDLLNLLRTGGRYASAGAIAGPRVHLDVRTMYLRDLTLVGCTAWDAPVFPSVVAAIEANEIRPVIAAEFPLADVVDAQRSFQEKHHVGKIVLVPTGT